jgi:hypothetical protein
MGDTAPGCCGQGGNIAWRDGLTIMGCRARYDQADNSEPATGLFYSHPRPGFKLAACRRPANSVPIQKTLPTSPIERRGLLGLVMSRNGYSENNGGRYRSDEERARREQFGIWAGQFEMQWEWRHRHQ